MGASVGESANSVENVVGSMVVGRTEGGAVADGVVTCGADVGGTVVGDDEMSCGADVGGEVVGDTEAGGVGVAGTSVGDTEDCGTGITV